MKSSSRRSKFRNLMAGMACLLLIACDGGGGGAPPPPDTQPLSFEKTHERVLDAGETNGMLQPRIQAAVDSNGWVHMVFFSAAPSYPVDELYSGHPLRANPMRFQIRYLAFDPGQAEPDLSPAESIVPVTTPHDSDDPPLPGDAGIDNCHLLGLDLTTGNSPVLVYQGGSRPGAADGLGCNNFYQGDLMVSLRNNGTWQEFLGIQGDASVKNPYFTDGMAGMSGDVAVDAEGNIHMVVQHFYEWCDQHSTHYPDLVYVRQSPSELGDYDTDMEQWVDQHNRYASGGGVENASGYFARIILDSLERPAVFFFAIMTDGSRLIRVSRLIEGQWAPGTIYEVPDEYAVAAISPALAPDGTLGAAYSLEKISDDARFGDHLCYAELTEDGRWKNTKVDYHSFCGRGCVLAFDHDSRPAIVYYDENPYTEYRERKDVKFAHFDGRQWQREIAANEGDIGLHNALWFDAANRANICTYVRDMHRILVLRRHETTQ